MDKHLCARAQRFKTQINITGSKSESNRLLLLQSLYPDLKIENLSNSNDTRLMQSALQCTDREINIQHAGTAMRFLTAYFAIQPGREVLLTGSARMKERPIRILVEALQNLGADIQYAEAEGFPPLIINGKALQKSAIQLRADVSSQYISALMLIAPKLENGLSIALEGTVASAPYIRMTLDLLKSLGVAGGFEGQRIWISPCSAVMPRHVTVESDWSSASYFYGITALAEIGSEISLSSYLKNSLQGDSALAWIYRPLGVETDFQSNNTIVLRKTSPPQISELNLNLADTPDLAQTIAVTCLGMGLGCHLTGLHTLKIKETDRLEALKTEFLKLGAEVSITRDALFLKPLAKINPGVSIATYKDHRMAMAFAMLCLKAPISILNAEEVSKSYPDFWTDLESFLL